MYEKNYIKSDILMQNLTLITLIILLKTVLNSNIILEPGKSKVIFKDNLFRVSFGISGGVQPLIFEYISVP